MALAAQIGPDYNPANVLFGNNGGTSPYISINGKPAMTTANVNQPQTQTLGAESIRATGQGPFDAAYRQNLATYAGGNFARPGGNLSFNPTDPNALMGNPTGGGNAPVFGIPNSLIQNAIGGSPFSANTAPPQPPASVSPSAFFRNNWRHWLQSFNDNGNMFRGVY